MNPSAPVALVATVVFVLLLLLCSVPPLLICFELSDGYLVERLLESDLLFETGVPVLSVDLDDFALVLVRSPALDVEDPLADLDIPEPLVLIFGHRRSSPF